METKRLIAPWGWGLAMAMLGLLLIGLAWTTPTSADSADPPDTTIGIR